MAFFNKEKKGAETEFSRLLRLYFEAEDCSLVGDEIVNLENEKVLGKLISASFTGEDLIIQAKLISGKEKGETTYEEHMVIVGKDTIEEFHEG